MHEYQKLASMTSLQAISYLVSLPWASHLPRSPTMALLSARDLTPSPWHTPTISISSPNPTAPPLLTSSTSLPTKSTCYFLILRTRASVLGVGLRRRLWITVRVIARRWRRWNRMCGVGLCGSTRKNSDQSRANKSASMRDSRSIDCRQMLRSTRRIGLGWVKGAGYLSGDYCAGDYGSDCKVYYYSGYYGLCIASVLPSACFCCYCLCPRVSLNTPFMQSQILLALPLTLPPCSVPTMRSMTLRRYTQSCTFLDYTKASPLICSSTAVSSYQYLIILFLIVVLVVVVSSCNSSVKQYSILGSINNSDEYTLSRHLLTNSPSMHSYCRPCTSTVYLTADFMQWMISLLEAAVGSSLTFSISSLTRAMACALPRRYLSMYLRMVARAGSPTPPNPPSSSPHTPSLCMVSQRWPTGCTCSSCFSTRQQLAQHSRFSSEYRPLSGLEAAEAM